MEISQAQFLSLCGEALTEEQELAELTDLERFSFAAGIVTGVRRTLTHFGHKIEGVAVGG